MTIFSFRNILFVPFSTIVLTACEYQQTALLRIASLRISGEHRGVTNIWQSEEQHHYALQTDTTSCMRICSMRERLQIRMQRLQRNTTCLCTLCKQLRIMNSLSTRDNLLSTNKDIIRIGQLLEVINRRLRYRILGIWHRVEGTNRQRELIQHVEVCVVLLLH